MKSYDALETTFERLHHLKHLESITYWDQAAMMPSHSNEARSKAMAEYGVLLHQLMVDPKIGELINKAKEEDLNEVQQASLREMKRRYDLSTWVPEDLVKAKSLAGSKCEHAWRTQRSNNDWKGFLENFKEVLNLSRQEASVLSNKSGLSPYDSLIGLYEPGMNTKTLDSIFGEVKTWLPGLIQDIVEKQKSIKVLKPEGSFSVEKQKNLGLKVMAKLGFDFTRGRVDISSHPFCGGVPEDVRMTTRYDENDFVKALMGIVHETGHARYEQNLPENLRVLPVGRARSMGIHESQSLFFEMQLGRSSSFLKSIHQDILDSFGSFPAFEIENLIKIYRQVKPDFIRVDADEVTYPAHIILRYEIEKALISGEIEASDIPDMWNEKMMSYLGVDTRDNFKQGPLQDIHWTDGSFGYFPSYTLGAMYAAQEFNAVKKECPDVDRSIEKGNYTQAFDWLKKNIWSQASLYTTDDLMLKATGEILNPNYLKNHLIERYLN